MRNKDGVEKWLETARSLKMGSPILLCSQFLKDVNVFEPYLGPDDLIFICLVFNMLFVFGHIPIKNVFEISG